MAVININFLRKEQSQVSRLGQATIIVGVVTGSIVALMLLVVVFLYTTIAIRAGEKDGLVQEQKDYASQAEKLTEAGFAQPFYPEMTLAQQAVAYQQQITGVKQLIDNHRYFTLYLSEIAVNTPTTIVYTSFASESADRLSVTGEAKTYSELSKLAKKFEGLSFARSVSIQDARLEKSGSAFPVKFTLVIELKSAAELKKLPGPNNPGNSSGGNNSPQPLPSGSPQVTASAPPGQLPLGGT